MDQFRLVYSGTIARRYGLDIGIRAVAVLASEMPDLRLLIVGSGDVGDCRRLVDDLKLGPFVTFQQHVPHHELVQLLKRSDVGISPHRNDAFGDLYFGTKLLEYLEVGLPVVASRTRTVEAYLKEAVFYFEPDDVHRLAEQIRLVRSRPDLVQIKRAHARAVLDEFDWRHWKGRIQQLVRDLCPNDPRSNQRSLHGGKR
jgi:glycosyltransferase involved in cell wall biosynthesis